MVVWPRLDNPTVSQNPEKFVRLIPQEIFFIVQIPLVCILKFKFFAQLPVDYLPHPVVSSLILFLY